MHACKTITPQTYVKDPVVHVRVPWIMEAPNPACIAKSVFIRLKLWTGYGTRIILVT